MSSAQLKSKTEFSQTGQGILEVIVTIAIGTIMILALVILSVRSNRASDFSKANSQASSLASEGLEIIRNIKSQNLANHVNYYGACPGSIVTNDWTGLFTQDLTDIPPSNNCNLAGYPGMISNIDTTISPAVLNINNVNPTDTPATTVFDVSFGGRTFKRYVYIADTASPTAVPLGVGKSNCNQSATDYQTLKQFTVVVSWTDSSGTHQSVQSDCLPA